MTVLIKHIASGQAFFTGVALVGLAVWLASRSRRARGAGLIAIVGLLLIGASATPLPRAFYVVATLVSLYWITVVTWLRRKTAETKPDPTAGRSNVPVRRSERAACALFAGFWLVGAGMEFPYHLTPTIPAASADRLTIFADSVTAGIGEREAVTWPELLAQERPIEVVDHSRMGATAESATLLAQQHPPRAGIVLLEIGGNDVLGDTTETEFAKTLGELLAQVSGEDRQVVMLELPLPPTFQEYGRIQRRLAKRYDVALVPKRFLLDVLLSEATTLDSIHLSQAGHRQMADQMWALLERCY